MKAPSRKGTVIVEASGGGVPSVQVRSEETTWGRLKSLFLRQEGVFAPRLPRLSFGEV